MATEIKHSPAYEALQRSENRSYTYEEKTLIKQTLLKKLEITNPDIEDMIYLCVKKVDWPLKSLPRFKSLDAVCHEFAKECSGDDATMEFLYVCISSEDSSDLLAKFHLSYL